MPVTITVFHIHKLIAQILKGNNEMPIFLLKNNFKLLLLLKSFHLQNENPGWKPGGNQLYSERKSSFLNHL